MPIVLLAVRYRDRGTRRWTVARYKATRDEISARYAEWEIIGPAEMRAPSWRAFDPHRVDPGRPQEPAPQINPHRDRPPALDAVECLLTLLFLRRYVAYCARRRRFAQTEGAARLYREVANARRALP
jgi:hypothetical protein